MKSFSVVLVVLVACLLLAEVEPRKTRGGGSRGGSKGSRGSSRRQPQPQQPSGSGQSLSHTGLSSLSYAGYNSPPAKKPQPSAPQPAKKPDQPIGWNVNKDTAVKKEVAGNSQSYPSNSQPAYPSSGGLSGAGGAQGSAGGHAYPPSNGLSGTGQAAGGAHSYPASGGASGASGQHAYPASNGASGQHAYPSSGGASGAAGQQHAYPASNGLSGSGPSQVRPPQTNAGQPPPYTPYSPAGNANAYPPAYPGNNPSYPGYNSNPHGGGYHNQGPPPPYSPQGYGGAPGYGGMSPGYGGYGGHGGFGGFGGGNNFGGYYGKPKSSFLSGNKFGLILAGLAVWNLARSGHNTNHYHYYNKDDPKSKEDPAHPREDDPILKDLVNCTLTMTSANDSDVVLIPCIIASSFSPDAKLSGGSAAPVFTPDSASPLNCTIGVLKKDGTEFKTNIPCESLSSLAPKDNATMDGPRNGTVFDEPDPPLEVIPLSTPSTTTVVNPDLTSTTVSGGESTPSTTAVINSSTSMTPLEIPSSTAVASDGTPKPE